MIRQIRVFARKNLFIRRLIGYHLASSGLFDSYFKNYKVNELWEKRITDVLFSSDNEFIPKVNYAGNIRGGKQIMHNGIKIHLGSYYGPEYSKMLLLSKGVHEPQEERIFMEALKTLPDNALMIEMGAFWSFYSMWFNKEIKGATNYMIEPDAFNLGQGKRNFKLNNMNGTFIQGFVGSSPEQGNDVPTVSVDQVVDKYAIQFIHMLHSDIQGFEHEMLIGAQKTFDAKKVGYVFISTHTNEVHYKCLDYLLKRKFVIIANIDLNETFSEDGLIAARDSSFNGIDAMNISRKSVSKSS